MKSTDQSGHHYFTASRLDGKFSSDLALRLSAKGVTGIRCMGKGVGVWGDVGGGGTCVPSAEGLRSSDVSGTSLAGGAHYAVKMFVNT